MRKWLLLGGAIGCEVSGTMLLRGSKDLPAFVPLVVIAYVLSFVLLGLALRAGFVIGIAYGLWGAVGVALTALLGAIVFGEVLSATAMLGIAVIVVGVVVIETGGRASPDADRQPERLGA